MERDVEGIDRPERGGVHVDLQSPGHAVQRFDAARPGKHLQPGAVDEEDLDGMRIVSPFASWPPAPSCSRRLLVSRGCRRESPGQTSRRSCSAAVTSSQSCERSIVFSRPSLTPAPQERLRSNVPGTGIEMTGRGVEMEDRDIVARGSDVGVVTKPQGRSAN